MQNTVKKNLAYFEAWFQDINKNNNDVLLIISQSKTGDISVNTINELSQDKMRELFTSLINNIANKSTIIK